MRMPMITMESSFRDLNASWKPAHRSGHPMTDNLERELRELPERFGFANLTRFIDALRVAARHGAVQAPKSPLAGRKRYARVTPRKIGRAHV